MTLSGAKTCEIQWIDEDGLPTPHDDEATGYAFVVAHKETTGGRIVNFEESKHFLICAEHAKRLSDAGMEHWRFVPLKGSPQQK